MKETKPDQLTLKFRRDREQLERLERELGVLKIKFTKPGGELRSITAILAA